MKAPKQRRSYETLLRLRDAGLKLVGDAGPDSLTVHEVARRARSSVGSFYQRFEGKDEFLVHLWIHENSAAAEEWERRIGEVPVDRDDLVCRLGDLVGEAEAERGAALRKLRDYLNRSELMPDVPVFADRLAELVRAAVRARAEALGAPDPDKASRIVAACLFMSVEAGTDGRAPFAGLLAPIECVDLEALLRPAAADVDRPARKVTDPFDVWDEGTDLDDQTGPFGIGA